MVSAPIALSVGVQARTGERARQDKKGIAVLGRQVPESQGRMNGAAFVAALVAVVLLALALVDLVLAIISPISADVRLNEQKRPEQGLAYDLSVLTDGNIFEGAQPSASGPLVLEEELPVTTLQLKLKGTFPSREEGGLSTAIIETPGGQQQRFAEGDQVVRGVTLEKVQDWRVIISRNGTREALLFPSRPELQQEGGEGAPDPSFANPQGDAVPIDVADFVATMPMRGQTMGEIFGPALGVFDRQGIRPRDLPLAVNGEPITAASADWQAILDQAAADGSFILTVQRDDKQEDIILTLPDGMQF
ncbi:type II secretion system protein N [Parvularcula lutaonensis]|uniref:Type II secretion system protein N n=1 Tax=Parvularcula lutaonensis TaxID=491923 RepID=A0ABV7MDC1_9PROT|nr:type II secretion system protein N [Parvularcula lutaonensis]GGY52677.1 hypothetical protein GCM10007148_22370 [Parvularcula lutaonensis]